VLVARDTWRRAWPAAACVLGVLLVFGEALFTDRVFYERDLALVWYPRVASMIRAIGQGAWPLWDPHPAFGVSAAVDPSYQLWYPPAWLNLILQPTLYLKVHVLLHGVGTAIGMLLLLRFLGLSRAASALGGLVWAASGPWLSLVMHHHLASASWMPWVLLAFLRFWALGTWGAALLMTLAAAGQLLGGSADMCMLAAWIAPFALLISPTGPGIRDWRKMLGRGAKLLAAGGLTVALVAPQWVPTFVKIRSTNRAGYEPGSNMQWSLHPREMLEIAAPGVWAALPWSRELREEVLGSREPFLKSIYLGIAAFPLVILGLLGLPRKKKLALLAGGAFFLIGALGHYAPLYPLLLKIPLLQLFRYPVKWMVAAALLWSVAVAWGIEALGRGRVAARYVRVVAAVAGALALVLFLGVTWVAGAGLGLARATGNGESEAVAAEVARRLLWPAGLAAAAMLLLVGRDLARRHVAALTVAYGLLVAVDVVSAGRDVNSLAPPELLAFHPPIIDRMEGEKDEFRFCSTTPRDMKAEALLAHGPVGWRQEWAWILGKFEAIRPFTEGRWGLYAGFDGDATGLADTGVLMVTRMAYAASRARDFLRVLRIWNMRYVIGYDEARLANLEKVGEWSSVAAVPLGLWRVPGSRPRAYVVDRARAATGLEAVRRLMARDFDLGAEIVVSRPEEARAGVPGFSGRLRTVSRRADRVEIETSASGPAYLVLVDAYDDGWSATVDGRQAKIVRANLVGRAVPVPAGSHRVVFSYWPAGLSLGLALGALGLAVVLGWLVASLRRRQRAAAGAER
jgi:hypothetical protein